MQNNNTQHFDLVIIGGGVNGCAIAADASIKGLNVCIIEKDTLAQGTSSNSSNLIHGGLRYLEQYDFKLVREALIEQSIWQKRAPHLVKPLAFILPHEKHLRSKHLIRLGLWLYDHLTLKKLLPKTRSISRQTSETFKPLKSFLTTGFEYYDCHTRGAALTIAHARLAREFGATILTHANITRLNEQEKQWHIDLSHHDITKHLTAKAVINATGPWLKQTQSILSDFTQDIHLQNIKGSHIIVPKLYDGDHAYILQHKDGRIVFALPYTDKTTAIGTTDITYKGDLNNIEIDSAEEQYLCDLINEYFTTQLHPNHIISSWSGVRALAAESTTNASKMSRDHQICLTEKPAPLITLVGGKLTNSRLVAEQVIQKLKPHFPNMKNVSTTTVPFLGGNLSSTQLKQLTKNLIKQFPFIDTTLLQRWVNQFGKETITFLEGVKTLDDLGYDFGHGLYAKEVDHLKQHYFCESAYDILFKITQLHVSFSAVEKNKLTQYLSKGSL